jgi:hypothetical protein
MFYRSVPSLVLLNTSEPIPPHVNLLGTQNGFISNAVQQSYLHGVESPFRTLIVTLVIKFTAFLEPKISFIILSRVRGSVTNNNGFWSR